METSASVATIIMAAATIGFFIMTSIIFPVAFFGHEFSEHMKTTWSLLFFIVFIYWGGWFSGKYQSFCIIGA